MADLLVNALALALVWLFARAAWHKWRSPAHYHQLLRRWLPDWMPAGLINHAVAALELFTAILLLSAPLRLAGLWLAATLLAVYAAWMAWQLQQDRADLDCGCTGPARHTPISGALIQRNLLVAILAVAAALSFQGTALSAAAWVVISLAALFSILLYLCAEQLIDNRTAAA